MVMVQGRRGAWGGLYLGLHTAVAHTAHRVGLVGLVGGGGWPPLGLLRLLVVVVAFIVCVAVWGRIL